MANRVFLGEKNVVIVAFVEKIVSLCQHWFLWAASPSRIKRESGANPGQFPLL